MRRDKTRSRKKTRSVVSESMTEIDRRDERESRDMEVWEMEKMGEKESQEKSVGVQPRLMEIGIIGC